MERSKHILEGLGNQYYRATLKSMGFTQGIPAGPAPHGSALAPPGRESNRRHTGRVPPRGTR